MTGSLCVEPEKLWLDALPVNTIARGEAKEINTGDKQFS